MHDAYYKPSTISPWSELEAKYGHRWRQGKSMAQRWNRDMDWVRFIDVWKVVRKLPSTAAAAEYLTEWQQRWGHSLDKVGWRAGQRPGRGGGGAGRADMGAGWTGAGAGAGAG